jgi:hypothetical protein|uniref:Uncharacterized protein n=1 Tax=viral metagenome TaxID=1070528 RepID=A0A6C0EFB9_9ZZZZ
MNKRIIDNNKEIISLKSNNSILHPLTCDWMNAENDICLTKYTYNQKNKTFNYYSNYKCKNNINIDEYKNKLYIPPLGIGSDILLKIYEINSEDSLIDWIENNLDTTNILTVNRILNCWIINNLEILKDHHDILIKIYINLIMNYSNKNIIKLIENNKINLNKETKYFIDYWINKYNNNNFKFNLLEDYTNYINKKYL